MTPERKAKMKWQCRRGMLELDLVLNKFLYSGFEALSDQQLLQFEQLLSHQDPDIYAWLMGQEQPMSMELKEIVDIIHACSRI